MRLARLFEAFILFAIILGLTPLHPTAAPCWARCASTRSAVRRRSMIQRGMANATVHCRSSIPSAMVRPRTGRTSAAATPPKLNGTNHGQKSLKYAGHLAYATCAARGCGSLPPLSRRRREVRSPRRSSTAGAGTRLALPPVRG